MFTFKDLSDLIYEVRGFSHNNTFLVFEYTKAYHTHLAMIKMILRHLNIEIDEIKVDHKKEEIVITIRLSYEDFMMKSDQMEPDNFIFTEIFVQNIRNNDDSDNEPSTDESEDEDGYGNPN